MTWFESRGMGIVLESMLGEIIVGCQESKSVEEGDENAVQMKWG